MIIWSPAAFLNYNIWVIAPIISQTMAKNEPSHAWLNSHAPTNMDLRPLLSSRLLKCLPTSLLTWCHLLTMTDHQLLRLCRNALTWFDRTTPAWDLRGGRTERLLTHERFAGAEVNWKIMTCQRLQWAHMPSTSRFHHGSWHEGELSSVVFQPQQLNNINSLQMCANITEAFKGMVHRNWSRNLRVRTFFSPYAFLIRQMC